MDSDNSPPRSRCTRHEDADSYDRERKSRRPHREDSDRHREKDREREGSRDRDRRRRRRSRSPRSTDSHKRTSRSRERERHRDRDHRRKRSPDDKYRDRGGRDYSRRKRDRDTEAGDDESRGKQVIKRSGPLPSQSDSFALMQGEEPPKPKEKPNYGTTGTLAAASNSVVQSDGSTIVLKYHEPPEARKPKDQWKLFIFKGQEIVDTVELSHRTCWLMGREVAVVDLAAEHPSVSKQHAVIQFRYLEKRNEYGDKIGKVKPYLIDLESANGTMLNSKKVPESRYLELRDKDLIQFGQSTREYVLMLAPKN